MVKIGREPKHSLAVTIPRKICKALHIEKGGVLYFKLEENRFVVSKENRILGGSTESNKHDTVTVESVNQVTKEKENVIMGGISLADLQY
ncbi:MAG: AbrB/MazE/SpoVT family DNA-binding domain-containing protein [Nitrosopumilaceae archaeon]